jgi:hypothetical protein
MYVGIALDTYWKWGCVCVFTAISSFMNDFAGESLEPFFLMVFSSTRTMRKRTHRLYYKFTTAKFTDTGIDMYVFVQVLRDHKTRFIPYSKITSVMLNQAWTLYCSIMSVFGLYAYFSQIDILLIKMVVAMIVNLYSSRRYLRNKQHDATKYQRYFDNIEEDDDLESSMAITKTDDIQKVREQPPGPDNTSGTYEI